MKDIEIMATEIRVPALGESVTEATIGRWFKTVGEAVKADEPVVELETDKVTIEVPAPVDGVLTEVLVQAGETVGVGALLGALDVAGAAKPAAAKPVAAAPVVAAAAPAQTNTAPAPATTGAIANGVPAPAPVVAVMEQAPMSHQGFNLDRPLREARDGFEKAYFEFHLAREGGSMTRVAEKTGLERTHLYRKLRQLGVDLGRNKRNA